MPAFDYDRLEADRLASLPSAPAAPELPGQEEDLGFFSAAGDVLLAPARGVLGAGQGILSLADTLSFDLLPDWLHETNPLGESKTIVGGLVEGISQFAVGFVPGLGLASRLGVTGVVARGALAGAVADFAVFQADEDRLSNLVQAIPALRNPVTEFLAAKEDDPELAGRLKNVVEGGLVGAAFDGIAYGLRRIKAVRAARAARPDASAEEIARAVDKAVPLDEAARRGLEDATLRPDDPLTTLRSELPSEEPEALARFLTADEDGVRQVLDAFESRADLQNKVNPRNLTPEERLANAIESTDINLDHFQGEEGAFQLWRAIEGLSRSQARLVPGTVARTVEEQRLANVKALTSILGEAGKPEETLARLTASARKLGESQVQLTHKIGALNIVAQKYVGEAHKLTKAIVAGTASPQEQARFAQHLGTLADFLNVVKGLGSESGRQLRFRRETVDLLDGDALRELVSQYGGEKRLQKLAERVQTLWNRGGSPYQVVQFLEQHPKLAAIQEWWVGSMLSRVSTSAVDFTSAVGFSAYRPLNALAGGLARRDRGAIRQGLYQIQHFASGWSESMRAWGRTFRSGENRLDALAISRAADLGQARPRSALSPQNLGVDPTSAAGRTLGLMSRFTQTVFNVLKANEEFVKTLTTHSYGRALIQEEGLNRGLQGGALNRFVEDSFKEIVRDGQLLSRRVLVNEGYERIRARGGLTSGFQAAEEASRYADQVLARPEMDGLSAVAEKVRERGREVTFTTRADDGDWFGKVSNTIQGIRQRHPMARFVLPFVNTPINIVRSGLQQVDALGPIRYAMGQAFSESRFVGAATLERSRNRFIREMLSGDATKAADAVGRVGMGLGAMATFGSLAYAGVITGKGPDDPKTRRQLQAAGWRPYSIKIGEKYVSYGRFEPIATVAGIVADAMTASKWLPPEDQNGIQTAVLAGALSIANQATNKTFLKGLADFVDVVHEPARFAEEYVAGFVSTFAVPGAAQQFVPALDPHFREARGIVDRVLQRVPGLSRTLPASRNLLGEPVSNGTVFQDVGAFLGEQYGKVSDDAITRELAGLGGFYPPSVSRLGVDLRDVPHGGTNAYDRYLALHGKVKLGGRTLRRALGDLIRSSAYQALPAEGSELQESPRRLVIRRIVSQYRRAAWYQLLEDVPELGARQRQQRLDRASLFSGRPGGAVTDPEGFLSR